MSGDTGIRATQVDGIRYITFDRPAKLNVLTPASLHAVINNVHDAARCDRAIVFSGTGDRSFSAGMHLDCFSGLDSLSAKELIENIGEMLATVRTSPIPTIAAINGYCLGAAFELVLTCDVRIAVDQIRFGLPEVKVGIPSVLDASLLKDYVGLTVAKEMMLTGDLYDTSELDGTRLFNQVVPREQLKAATDDIILKLTEHTWQVLATQKRLFNAWQDLPHSVGLAASINEFSHMFDYPETLEQIEKARQMLVRKKS